MPLLVQSPPQLDGGLDRSARAGKLLEIRAAAMLIHHLDALAMDGVAVAVLATAMNPNTVGPVRAALKFVSQLVL